MILLPSVAAFPPTSEHKAITPDAWENALDCWIIVIRDLLSRSVEEFSLNIIKDHSFVEFLVSYTRETAFSKSSSRDTAEKTSTLRLSCFFLTHRLLMQMSPVPPELLNPTFLADFSIIFYKSESCRELLESVWDRENLDDNPLIIKSKSTLIQVFETQNMEHKSEFTILIRRTACLLQKSYQYGQFLTLGSDFLESLVTAFERHSAPLQERLVMVGYWALESLLKHRRPRISTLIDHLFTLKSSPRLESFLRRICLSTPFLSRLQARLPSSERDRASGLMQELRAYTSLDDRSRFARSKIKKKKKGKEKRETINSRQDTLTNIHVHKMSFITQVQDLFPDLESRFIVKLLDKHNDDPEQVIAHLLENSSPTNFRVAHEAKTLYVYVLELLRSLICF